MDAGSSLTARSLLLKGGYFLLGGVITCAGMVCSANPVTLKVADMAGEFFSSHKTLASELVFKLAGLVLAGVFCYYAANRCDSSQDRICLIAGAVLAAMWDTTAYVIASL